MHAVHINFVPAPPGHSPEQLFELWPSLADIPEAAASGGARVSVIQAAAQQARITRNGIDYYFVDVVGMRVAARARRFADVLLQIDADVAHVHGLGFARDIFALSRCLPQLSIIVQDHADRLPRWWRRLRWKRWFSVVSGVVFTARELALPFTRAGVFGSRTRLFAIPESSSRFTPGSRVHARAETGLYGDPCVLWVGHLNAGKDPLTVLEGIAQASVTLPDVQLWCAFANAPLLEQVQQYTARDSRLADRVHLLGKVAHADVERLMQSSDIFVSGSHAESCGFVVLEAMACGVAPVITDIPSFRALTNEGRVGHLWPCGDAVRLAESLVAAVSNPTAPERIRAHFDATLSFKAVGRQWATAYAQVLDARRRAP
ncbi:glycosyltransferase family 4 protein [Rhodanobacter sp. L36]|uniref:glycosyltransferase family 4 protein n=1 Tax=Rhodanobacter sp. L36 TaxID=1747221 RepID=UPI00131DD696|nr:glycosyltransferase family 4 protein [Rhodanobacter sp. L36]